MTKPRGVGKGRHSWEHRLRLPSTLIERGVQALHAYTQGFTLEEISELYHFSIFELLTLIHEQKVYHLPNPENICPPPPPATTGSSPPAPTSKSPGKKPSA